MRPELGVAVDVGEETQRALQLGQQIVEHRPHGLENRLGVLGRGGVALEVLRLGEGQLQLLGQGLGEVVAAQRHAPLPHAIAVGHHQVGGVGPQRHHHHRLGRILGVIFLDRRQIVQLVEQHVVVQRQRRELHVVDFDARTLERLDSAEDGVALHGEQADFRLQREAFFLAAAAHPLVVPDHVVQIEGDLLAGFVADDVGDLLGFHRRQLDEPRQAALAGNRNRHPVAVHLVAREELPQRVGDQFGGVGVRLAEDLRILDEVECLDYDLVGVVAGTAAQCLQRTLPDVDSPHCVASGHAAISPLVGGNTYRTALSAADAKVCCPDDSVPRSPSRPIQNGPEKELRSRPVPLYRLHYLIYPRTTTYVNRTTRLPRPRQVW